MQDVGINAYGHRHKILKGVEKLMSGSGVGGTLYSPTGQPATVLMELLADEPEYHSVDEQLSSTIREHKENAGGVYSRYNIIKVGRKSYCKFLHKTRI